MNHTLAARSDWNEPARWNHPASWPALAAFLALCYGVAWLGSSVTLPAIPVWYAGLAKPPFAPPNWLFGPVWGALYGLMGFAAWRVWLHRDRDDIRLALTLFFLQLALNLAWSFLFFGLRSPLAGLAGIVPLLALIFATLVAFGRIDRLAGLAFVPYLAWVSFATALNAGVWLLN